MNFTSNKFMAIAGFLGVYLLSAGSSWALFSYIRGTGISSINLQGLEAARSKINLELPRTETCPINGGKFTKVERDIWEGRRPLAAIIENHADSRPPSGLSRADVVYEAVAEGGITRFLAIYHCGAAAMNVLLAPVRSARIYFVNLAAGYGDRPIFAHVGGANAICGNCPGGVKSVSQVAREVRAIEELASLGWRVPRGNDFDTTYDSGFPVFWRNYERLGRQVASEHTMMASTDKIFEEAAKRGFTNTKDGKAWDRGFTPWKFKEESKAPEETDKLSFEFWGNKPEYNVEWRYDGTSNEYLRFNGGKAHTDLEYDNKQIAAKNVAIMFVKERGPVDSETHMYYEVLGQGSALVFQNGSQPIEGTWKKEKQESQVRFFDKSGKEILFVGGTTWIELVPSGNDVDY